MPYASVIMSFCNTKERFLFEAINSILTQTFNDFEFIIINDGSVDQENVLSTIKDRRIKYICTKNQGLTKALNFGIKQTVGKYILRMDADDIALPERIKLQVDYMEENPLIGVAGSWYWWIDDDGRRIRKETPPTEHNEIVRNFLWSAPIIHPLVIIRRSVIEKVGTYDERFRFAQDREFFLRTAQFFKLGNVPKDLLLFRSSKDSIGISKEMEQKKYCAKAIISAIDRGLYPKWCYLFAWRYLFPTFLPKRLLLLKNLVARILKLRRL